MRARALEPFTLKGIGRPIIPYVVDAAEGKEKVEHSIITEHSPGIDLFLDVRAVTSTSSERIAQVLEAALAAVRNAATPAAGSGRSARLPKPLDRRHHHLTAKPADIHLLDSTE